MDSKKMRDAKDKLLKKLANGKEQMKTAFVSAAGRVSSAKGMQEAEDNFPNYEVPDLFSQETGQLGNCADSGVDEGIYEDFAYSHESPYSYAQDDTYDYPETKTNVGKKRFGFQQLKKQFNNLKLPDTGFKNVPFLSDSGRSDQKNQTHKSDTLRNNGMDSSNIEQRSHFHTLPRYSGGKSSQKPFQNQDEFSMYEYGSCPEDTAQLDSTRDCYGDVHNSLYRPIETINHFPVQEKSGEEAEEHRNPLYGGGPIASSYNSDRHSPSHGMNVRETPSTPASPNKRWQQTNTTYSTAKELQQSFTSPDDAPHSASNSNHSRQQLMPVYSVQSGYVEDNSSSYPLSAESGFEEPIFGTIEKESTSYYSVAEENLTANSTGAGYEDFSESDVYEYH